MEVFFRASPAHPITKEQLRRNNAIGEILNKHGIRHEFVNVGADAELEARVRRLAGLAGAEEDWPIPVWRGEAVGHAQLPALLARIQEELQHPQSEEGEEAEEVHNEQVTASASPPPFPMEASVNVLDMRLSVLGNQFRDTALTSQNKYPELDESVAEQEEKPGKPAVSPNGVDPQSPLRTVDLALEGLEWAVLKGATWLQGFVSSPPPPEVEVSRFPDFEVVQSNWYGRQQKRLLRITATHVERVHPMTGEVRYSVAFGDLVALALSEDGSTLQILTRGDSDREVVTDTYITVYAKQIIESIRKHRKISVIKGQL